MIDSREFVVEKKCRKSEESSKNSVSGDYTSECAWWQSTHSLNWEICTPTHCTYTCTLYMYIHGSVNYSHTVLD